jgi:hypothetical protein
MKIDTLIKPFVFALPLAFGALVACGPDKDDSAGKKAGDAVEEAGDKADEAAEEVDDEIDDHTDDK